MLLDIKNVSKRYGQGPPVLNNVSLTLSSGVFGLLGPNGAGKTTLMKVLATLLPSDSGQIVFNKLTYGEQNVAIRELIGYLPQDFGLFPNLSAREVLGYLASLRGISPTSDLIDYWLEQVNLFGYRNRPLRSLSGGMKQRFGIAQALFANPSLLIVDEPTAGLDPSERNRFYNLLARLGNHIIVIFSTHIVEDVKEICSSVGIMNKGQLLFKGTLPEIQDAIKGKVWEKEIEVENLEAVQASETVLLQRFRQGKPFVHVYAQDQPEGYQSVTPTLEDFFFMILR